MTTRILIARHGNTFSASQTPTRIGARTDLALTEELRARAVGKYIKQKYEIPYAVFVAPLKRTIQTAELACDEMNVAKSIIIKDTSFTEIDYGPDENKTEEEVELRLGKGNRTEGKKIIDAWNSYAIVPDGWKVDSQQYIMNWINWGKKVIGEFKNKTILIVSSNGVMRFSLYLTGDFQKFTKKYEIKVTTGGLCVFENYGDSDIWQCVEWNTKCKDFI